MVRSALAAGFRGCDRSPTVRSRVSVGSMTLDDLYAQRGVALCVTATDLGAARGRVFSTPHGVIDVERMNLALVDVCIASSSPPMLLPPIPISARGQERRAVVRRRTLGNVSGCGSHRRGAGGYIRRASDRDPFGGHLCDARAGERARRCCAVRGIGLWIRGLRALQVAGDAQARAAVDFARRVVPQLRRDVRLVRLRDPEPTDEEATVVRLDNAGPAAFEAMEGTCPARRSTQSGEHRRARHRRTCRGSTRCCAKARQRMGSFQRRKARRDGFSPALRSGASQSQRVVRRNKGASTRCCGAPTRQRLESSSAPVCGGAPKFGNGNAVNIPRVWSCILCCMSMNSLALCSR